jgi:hypothetical protein
MPALLLEVTPYQTQDVYRTIEITDKHNLHHLHRVIQDAFLLDDEQLYAFFMKNRRWDKTFMYGGPNVTAKYSAQNTALSSLSLHNKRFLYLFDFGDELRYEVRVLEEREAEEGVQYPRIVDAGGKAPPQYRIYDENDASDDENLPSEKSAGDPEVLESVTCLVPRIREVLDRIESRSSDPEAVVELSQQNNELTQEHDLAQEFVRFTGNDMNLIYRVESMVEANVFDWMMGLPRRMSNAGLLEGGLALARSLYSVFQSEQINCNLPLILARAGFSDEARERLAALLSEYPEDWFVLLMAGETYLIFNECHQAKKCLEDALFWVGDFLEGRDRILHEIRKAKVGRNDPCPCGSGMKYKKCCIDREIGASA